MHPIYLSRHIEVILRDPAGGMSAERADDLGVADVDVRVMVGRFRRLGDGRNEVDSSQKAPKLKRLRYHITAPTPSLETSQLALNSNVG
jgi:hypothetical protein